MRVPFACLLWLAACGTSPDERPATVDVIALEILAPTCGQVQCHSSTSKIQGYAFDTIDGAKAALRDLVGVGGRKHDLIEVLTDDSADRMPPDSPLADDDLALIEAWIAKGAPGL
jgi:hypothetical protein